MEKENFFPMKTFFFFQSYQELLTIELCTEDWEKKIVSVKSSILRDFWDTGMSRNLHEMHEMYWVFIFDQR